MQFAIELETYEKERNQVEEGQTEGANKEPINLSDVSSSEEANLNNVTDEQPNDSVLLM